MAKFENLKLSIDNSILTITINRPDRMNALNLATIEELRNAIQSVYDDKEIKGVILTGAGEKAFVAGADIKELSELNAVNSRKFAENGQEVFELIESCHTPVIAAINGFALGGGCELAMACHIRLATRNAKFGQPEVNLGIIPGYGGTQRLPLLIGRGRALELMMTGDMIDAEKALQFGLVNHLFDNIESMIEKATAMLEKVGQKAPLAIGQIVECVNALYSKDENGYQKEANAFSSCCQSDDFKEGTLAFLEKRPPQFKGE